MAVAHLQLNWRALMLATVSFAVSFAAWGLIGALAPVFTGSLQAVGVADGAAGRGARPARLAGAAADGHVDRSLRRPGHVHDLGWPCPRAAAFVGAYSGTSYESLW